MRQEHLRRLSPPAADTPGAWRLERKIPLTLFSALVGQCVGLIVWGTYLEARLEAVEHAQAEQAGLNEKFARLEERIDALRGDIAQMRRQLDRLAEHGR